MRVISTRKDVIPVPLWCHSSLESSLYYAATYLKLSFLDPRRLCCIASYDGLKIKKMENISSLL
ncbi:hypothetical protein OZD63_03650, partial [Wolbachia endosymbiont of Drosophila leontia]|uniref:hypothetical protein n=1 Tax=Wolbachia endosymbiont of Drosophila leontia TaxID=3002580 RepID=UPI0023A948E0